MLALSRTTGSKPPQQVADNHQVHIGTADALEVLRTAYPARSPEAALAAESAQAEMALRLLGHVAIKACLYALGFQLPQYFPGGLVGCQLFNILFVWHLSIQYRIKKLHVCSPA
jgi:hypothetical protein